MISAPASDDEGSTAATDGSTLRTSPAEHGGSVGSESGGSAIDSVAGEHSGGWFRQKTKNPTTLKWPWTQNQLNDATLLLAKIIDS